MPVPEVPSQSSICSLSGIVALPHLAQRTLLGLAATECTLQLLCVIDV